MPLMEEKQKRKNINLFVIVAIAIVALLLVVSVFQIVSINKKRRDEQLQKEKLESVQQQIEFQQQLEDRQDDFYDYT